MDELNNEDILYDDIINEEIINEDNEIVDYHLLKKIMISGLEN